MKLRGRQRRRDPHQKQYAPLSFGYGGHNNRSIISEKEIYRKIILKEK